MRLDDAIQMAERDEPVLTVLLRDEALRADILRAIRYAFWAYAWPELRGVRIRAKWGPFRPSVKVEHLRWFFVQVFGEPQAAGVSA